VPRLYEFYSGICLTTEEKARIILSQGKKNISQIRKNLSHSPVYILPKTPTHYKALTNTHITKPIHTHTTKQYKTTTVQINPLNAELNPICYLLALLGAHHFLHVSRIRIKSLTLRLLMSYIYGAPILDVSRSHTTTQQIR